MSVVATICLVMLAIAAVLCMARLLYGPTLADRVIALDALLVTAVIAIGVWTATSRKGTYVDALLIVALVAFIGTATVARFIERRRP